MNDFPRNPTGFFRRQERNDISNIRGLRDSLQCLHSKRHLATCLGLCEIRHVSVDHARRDRVYTDALRPKNG